MNLQGLYRQESYSLRRCQLRVTCTITYPVNLDKNSKIIIHTHDGKYFTARQNTIDDSMSTMIQPAWYPFSSAENSMNDPSGCLSKYFGIHHFFLLSEDFGSCFVEHFAQRTPPSFVVLHTRLPGPYVLSIHSSLHVQLRIGIRYILFVREHINERHYTTDLSFVKSAAWFFRRRSTVSLANSLYESNA